MRSDQENGARYSAQLARITQHDLRFSVVIANLSRHADPLAAKRGLGGAEFWLEKFTHMLEEMQLRFGPYPCGFTRDIFHSEPFPPFASDLAAKAGRAMSSKGLSGGDVLIKFGKRRHMEALYETGALRIQPASYLLKKDHNGAVRDDELSAFFFGCVIQR
jgi:hypothetical protein